LEEDAALCACQRPPSSAGKLRNCSTCQHGQFLDDIQ
jgi:hypothetical protein